MWIGILGLCIALTMIVPSVGFGLELVHILASALPPPGPASNVKIVFLSAETALVLSLNPTD